jgi:hypothetical protein
MSDSLFQKEQNDQIPVKDINLPNPLPTHLDELYGTDAKSFIAKPHVVLRCLYDGAQSLSAFSGDPIVSYYVVYHRDERLNPTFLAYNEEPESLKITTPEHFIPEAQAVIRI